MVFFNVVHHSDLGHFNGDKGVQNGNIPYLKYIKNIITEWQQYPFFKYDRQSPFLFLTKPHL